MGFERIKSPRYESVISLSILVMLIAIGSVIIIPQLAYKAPQFRDITSAAGPITNGVDAILETITPAGFKDTTPISIYNADNLYEKIDGRATLYTESGFEKLYTRLLVSQADESLMLEFYVYDMGLLKNAFFVYSTQKRPDAQPLPSFNPNFAYKTDNAVFFVKGKYYVELIGSAVSEKLLATAKDFAEKFAQSFADQKTEIPEFSILSCDNLIPGQFKLYTADAFGCEGLNNTFTAIYKIDDKNTTVFISRQDNPQKAKELAEKYYKFLLDTGGEKKKLEIPIESASSVSFPGSVEVVFYNGNFTTGIHEAPDEKTAVKAAILLNDILKKAEQNEPDK
jgi:hypothetical protein